MTANHELERRIADFYASEAPPHAPDRLLDSALATIDTTHQRRALGGVPWRFKLMPIYARAAIAALVVIAVGVVGLTVLRPGQEPGVGSGTSPSPSTSASPSASARAGASPYVPPSLTTVFTSNMHGISLRYPDGWETEAATQPWTTPRPLFFQEPAGDFLYDPVLADHRFLAVSSQLLGGASPDSWATGILTAEGCGPGGPAVVDGARGFIGTCPLALVSIDGRGYMIQLYLSEDDPEHRDFDARAWFEEILATVRLQPDAAVDTAPSGSP